MLTTPIFPADIVIIAAAVLCCICLAIAAEA